MAKKVLVLEDESSIRSFIVINLTRAGYDVIEAETIYVAELLEANGFWELGITEDEVRSAFSLIPTEWTEGES